MTYEEYKIIKLQITMLETRLQVARYSYRRAADKCWSNGMSYWSGACDELELLIKNLTIATKDIFKDYE